MDMSGAVLVALHLLLFNPHPNLAQENWGLEWLSNSPRSIIVQYTQLVNREAVFDTSSIWFWSLCPQLCYEYTLIGEQF